MNVWGVAGLLFLISAVFGGEPAHAQDVSAIAGNITESVSTLPNLIAAFAYLMGLLLVVQGVLKLKSHVEQPDNGSGQGTTLRSPIIRLLTGGACFAMPIVMEALLNTFSGGKDAVFSPSTNPVITKLTGLAGSDGAFNSVLENITKSISDLPGLISAFAYLLGVMLVLAGILKLREHVEQPSQIALKEPLARLLTAGALFAAPTLFAALLVTIEGVDGSGFFSSASTTAAQDALDQSAYGQSGCTAGTTTLGGLICGIRENSALFPTFLEALSYLFGLIMGIWGILKTRDHVLNPQQSSVFEGISRFFAGGAFFALPALVEVFRNTISNDGLAAASGAPVTRFNEATGDGKCGEITGLGLDGVLACAMNDIFAPVHLLLNVFTFMAGMIFIMIGISRLIKGAQDGARGPSGIGTIMTFIMGGALTSYNELMRAASTTFMSESKTKTFATMPYLEGLSEVKPAAEAVIGAIIKFMIIVGLISFIRGLFIIRSVAEGSNQQASMMAAVTHIIGGALAVNLGPLLNAIQQTLGISKFGIAFS